MTQLPPSEMRLRDPLSQVTRNERRSLLAITLVGIILVHTGLVPTKIEALGVEFTSTDQKSLLAIIALSTLYFLAAFAIYATSDFVAWRLALRTALTESIWKQLQEDEDQSDELQTVRFRVRKEFRFERTTLRATIPISTVRLIFEIMLPIVAGIYAIILLLTTSSV